MKKLFWIASLVMLTVLAYMAGCNRAEAAATLYGNYDRSWLDDQRVIWYVEDTRYDEDEEFAELNDIILIGEDEWRIDVWWDGPIDQPDGGVAWLSRVDPFDEESDGLYTVVDSTEHLPKVELERIVNMYGKLALQYCYTDPNWFKLA